MEFADAEPYIVAFDGEADEQVALVTTEVTGLRCYFVLLYDSADDEVARDNYCGGQDLNFDVRLPPPGATPRASTPATAPPAPPPSGWSRREVVCLTPGVDKGAAVTAVDDAIRELRAQDGTVARPGLAVDDLEQLERRLGVRLPDAHRTLLLASNGIAVADGHFRVYGSGPEAVTDIVWWNEEDTWRFAWPDRDLGQYLFFGGRYSGAQLAYRREDLRSADGSGRPDPPLIFFGSNRMQPTPLRQRRSDPPFRFADWLTLTLKDARLHPDPPEVWRRFPRIPPTHLLVHVPPIVVAGEDPDNLVLLPAAAAMIANGDVKTQWYRMTPQQQVTGFHAYTDDRGRPRMRLEVQ